MSKEFWIFKTLKTIGLALILGVSFTACGAGSIKWKEEVQLSDGKIIIVERETIYERGGDEWASNRGGSKANEERIQFADPNDSKKLIEWQSVKKDRKNYPEIPIVFDTKSFQPNVFTALTTSTTCVVYSKYVYKNGAWVEEQLPEQFEQHPTNLLFASQEDLPTLLNLAEKNRRNNEVGHSKVFKQAGPNLKICSG